MKGVSAEEAARLIGGPVVHSGQDFVVCCPAHNDSTPSLALSDGSSGKLLWRCHAGCSQEAVADALKSAVVLSSPLATPAKVIDIPRAPEPDGIFSESDPDLQAYCHRLADSYGLQDIDFNAAGVTVNATRFFPALAKKNRANVPAFVYPILCPDGRVANKYKSVYRLLDEKSATARFVWPGSRLKSKRLMVCDKGAVGFFPVACVASDGSGALVVTGGEEKALVAIKAGLRAVSASHGEAGISPELAAMLVAHGNLSFIVAMDNDAAGFKATRKTAEALLEAGAESVRCVLWDSTLAEKYDLNNAFRDGGAERLKAILEGAIDLAEYPEEHASEDIVADTFGDFFTGAEVLVSEVAPVRWLIPGILPEGLSLLAADPKAGKTVLAYQIAHAVATGGEIFGQQANQAGVLYLDYELTPAYSKEYLRRICPDAPANLIFSYAPRFAFTPACGLALEKAIAKLPNIRLVVIDTLQHAIVKKGKGTAYEIDVEAHKIVKQIARQTGVAFLMLHHTNKGLGNGFDKISGSNGIRSSYDTNFYLAEAGEGYSLQIEGRNQYVTNSLPLRRTEGKWIKGWGT